MGPFELLQKLSVSLAIGLLIGLERGWVARDEPEGERAVGLRTLGLIALLGGVSGALALAVPGGAVILAVAFVTTAAATTYLRVREMERDKTFGATTVVTALLTFALGSLAVVAEPWVASAAAIAATGLLALKSSLHSWLRNLTWPELRAALTLLAMSVILLPILPDRGIGPLEAINPRELWLMTILIAAISFVGYVAMKWIGGAHAVILSGLAGGLVSCTAVTLSFSRLAK